MGAGEVVLAWAWGREHRRTGLTDSEDDCEPFCLPWYCIGVLAPANMLFFIISFYGKSSRIESNRIEPRYRGAVRS